MEIKNEYDFMKVLDLLKRQEKIKDLWGELTDNSIYLCYEACHMLGCFSANLYVEYNQMLDYRDEITADLLNNIKWAESFDDGNMGKALQAFLRIVFLQWKERHVMCFHDYKDYCAHDGWCIEGDADRTSFYLMQSVPLDYESDSYFQDSFDTDDDGFLDILMNYTGYKLPMRKPWLPLKDIIDELDYDDWKAYEHASDMILYKMDEDDDLWKQSYYSYLEAFEAGIIDELDDEESLDNIVKYWNKIGLDVKYD